MVIQSPTPAPSKDPVTVISASLAPELQEVERLLFEVIESDSPLVREVGEYVALTGGKKLRPMMTLLFARAFGRPGLPPAKLAAAMEIIHVATLLHDDVIDKAALRRGKPSVNAKWGDDVAILMADYLFASAFELALDHVDPQPLRLVCQVTKKMCEGEMFQIERRGQWLSYEDYLQIIRGKTAYLFSACCALGAIASGVGPGELALATAFGLNFGLAFQITDDALDYVAADSHWGKSIGMDLAAGKQTLPLILTMRDASEEDRRKLEAVMNNGRDIGVVGQLLERYGSIERSRAMAREFAEAAAHQLNGMNAIDTTARDGLLALTDYVVSRGY